MIFTRASKPNLSAPKLRPDGTDLLLASDFHGANACFRKLVALALKLHASAIVIAGDWSGKASIFYVEDHDGGITYFSETDGEGHISPQEISETLHSWRERGVYPIKLPHGALPSTSELAELETAARIRRLRQWLDYGAEKTANDIPLMAISGNDDGPEIDAVLSDHPWVTNLNEACKTRFGFEFFGIGFSTPTPWHTPRELSEEHIQARLSEVGLGVHDWSHAIGVIHVPPFNTGLDLAPDLVERGGELRLSARGMVSVGSTSVRSFIEHHRPLVVMSGHCHESKGLTRVGATVCINAGSQYHVGTLSACLIRIDGEGLRGYQFFHV